MEGTKDRGVGSLKIHFIVNEHAGSGRGKKVWMELKNAFTFQYEEHITQYTGHAKLLAKTITESVNEDVLIIAVGGDGTVHEVINGVVDSDRVVVGHVSAGSGNDFKRGFYSFSNAQEIEHFLKEKKSIQQNDTGIMIWNDEQFLFVNNAGIGFDAYVTTMVNSSKVKKWFNKLGVGKLSYVYFTIFGLFTFPLFEIEIEVDGRTIKYNNVWLACISNQPYFGGGMKISPRSIVNDGKIELTIVHNLSRIKLLLLFVTVFFGSHEKMKEVAQFKAEQFTIIVKEPLLGHVDGERLPFMKNQVVHVKVNPLSWKMSIGNK